MSVLPKELQKKALHVKEKRRWYSLFLCKCGKTFYADRSYKKQSCGCMLPYKKHGHSQRTPEYYVWRSMRRRCDSPKEKSYKNYGGRGISVCKKWNDFSSFIKDMGFRPTPRHTIERINNNRNYNPKNCKWATFSEQRRNVRSNRFITYKQQTLCITDWSVKTKVSTSNLRIWIKKLGEEAAIEKAFKISLEKGRIK